MAEDSIIELKDVRKSFGPQVIFNGLNLKIPRGKTTVIIGRSGTGKSVLLKHIIGLIKPDAGQVLIGGHDITRFNDRQLNETRKNFGMLFQDGALFDSMSVGENVAFPLREHTKLKEAEIAQKVEEKLALVGLSGAAAKMPAQLSGGMRKRVGLARAIALSPQVILYDEPTTGLDPLMTDAINRLIKNTQEKLAATAVVISHDMAGAFQVGHKIAMLYGGGIYAEGSPEEIMATKDPLLRQFIEGRAEGPIEVV